MPISRPPYPPEFRAEAVELIRSGAKTIRGDLGVSDQTLRNWLKQADLGAGRRHDDLADKRLHPFEKASSYPALEPLIGDRIKVGHIDSQRDELLRLPTSIRQGTDTAPCASTAAVWCTTARSMISGCAPAD